MAEPCDLPGCDLHEPTSSTPENALDPDLKLPVILTDAELANQQWHSRLQRGEYTGGTIPKQTLSWTRGPPLACHVHVNRQYGLGPPTTTPPMNITFKHRNYFVIYWARCLTTDGLEVTIYEHMPQHHLSSYMTLPWSEADARIVAVQLFSALKYLHDESIFHRNVTPRNLFPIFNHEGRLRVKLGGFECATTKFPDSLSLVTVAETSHYMAPELFGLTSYIPTQGDNWAAGCVIFELIWGHPLFKGTREILTYEYKGTPDVEERLTQCACTDEGIAFIRGLIQCDLDKRFTASRALQHVWLELPSKNDLVTPQLAQHFRNVLLQVGAPASQGGDRSWCQQKSLGESIPTDEPYLGRGPPAPEHSIPTHDPDADRGRTKIQSPVPWTGQLEWFRRLLAEQEISLGLHHPTTLMTITDMAISLENGLQYSQAQELYERAYEGRVKALGAGHKDTLSSARHVAGLLECQQQYASAVVWHESRILPVQTAELGGDHRETLATMHKIASLFELQGQYWVALNWYNRALDRQKQALGLKHPETLATMTGLAVVTEKLGDYDRALEYYKEVLGVTEEVLGPDHLTTISVVYGIAYVLHNQGQYGQAAEWYHRALYEQKKTLGPDHPTTATTVNNIAVLFENQGNYESSEKWYYRALESRERSLGPEHPDTLATLNGIARICSNRGRLSEALEWYGRALEGRQKSLGKEHPETLATVANTLSLQGKLWEAEMLQREIVDKRRHLLGSTHPDTLTSMASLALTYFKQHRWDKAEMLQLQVMESRRNVLGTEHPDTLSCAANLGSTYTKQGRYTESVALLTQVIRSLTSQLGGIHPEVLHAKADLAVAYQNQSMYVKAESLLRQVLEGSVRSLGWQHPMSLTAYNKALTLQQELGKVAGRQELEQKLMEEFAQMASASRSDDLEIPDSIKLLIRTHEPMAPQEVVTSIGQQLTTTGSLLLSGSVRLAMEGDLMQRYTITQEEGGFVCATIQGYIDEVWGMSARGFIKNLVSGTGVGAHSGIQRDVDLTAFPLVLFNTPHSSETPIDVALPKSHSEELRICIEALAWMVGLFVAPNNSRRILEPRMRITQAVDGRIMVMDPATMKDVETLYEHKGLSTAVISIVYRGQEMPPESNTGDHCWRSLIKCGNIISLANRYRKRYGKGLMIPYGLMLELAAIERAVVHEGGIVLLGFQTALIPIERLPDGSVQWHLIISEGQTTRHCADILPTRLYECELSTLKGTAYLGWCRVADVVLGTDASEQAAAGTTFTTGLRQQGSSWSLQQLAAEIGASHGPLGAKIQGVLSRQNPLFPQFTLSTNFENRINMLWHARLIVYDSTSRIGWLVSKLHLVLYMIRCYLITNHYPKHQLRFTTGRLAGLQQARQEILAEANRWSQAYIGFGLQLEEVFGSLTQALEDGLIECQRAAAQSKQLVGFELLDIIHQNSATYAKVLHKSESTKMWKSLVIQGRVGIVVCANIGNALGPLSIVCANIGNALPPPPTIQPCQRIVPPGFDILAVLLKDLEGLIQGKCGPDTEVVLEWGDVMWKRQWNFFQDCSHGASCDGGCWSQRLQVLTKANEWYAGLQRQIKSLTERSSRTAMVSNLAPIPVDGGVCFGYMSG